MNTYFDKCEFHSQICFFFYKVYPEGTHFMLPWFERPIIYDVRARPYLVESSTGSHDLQTVCCLSLFFFCVFVILFELEQKINLLFVVCTDQNWT